MNSLDPAFHLSTIYVPQLNLALAVIALACIHWWLGAKTNVVTGAVKVAAALFGISLVGLAWVMTSGPAEWVLIDYAGLKIGLFLDSLSSLMAVLVGFLGLVITRYSKGYLEGDTKQPYFMGWLMATLASVMMLVLSGHLALFLCAWISVSLCLHKLLIFKSEREGAQLAARKKFVISRLGDMCLLAACCLIWKEFGTLDFKTLFDNEAVHSPTRLFPWIGGLLVASALIKSAQVPFHSWLPDTLETPTPVSALMHAGIINAGGYLVIRLSPLLVNAPSALDGLAIVGGITALVASFIMLVQTSVKKTLAWSTVSQMGFMMLQCGLGAFSLAMLHMVAHSLYKAYAFLSSGSLPPSRPAIQTIDERSGRQMHVIILAATLVTAGAVVMLALHTWNGAERLHASQFLLVFVLALALVYFLWNLWGSGSSRSLTIYGLLIVLLVVTSCFSLHALFAYLLEPSLPQYLPALGVLGKSVMAFASMLFVLLLLVQSKAPFCMRHRLFSRLYVHALSGFYLGTWLNKLVRPRA